MHPRRKLARGSRLRTRGSDEAVDKLDDQRTVLIEDIERQLRTTHEVQRLFTVRWTIR